MKYEKHVRETAKHLQPLCFPVSMETSYQGKTRLKSPKYYYKMTQIAINRTTPIAERAVDAEAHEVSLALLKEGHNWLYIDSYLISRGLKPHKIVEL